MPTVSESAEQDLRYPIGRYKPPSPIGSEERLIWLEQLEELPGQVRSAVQDLTPAQLDTPYRPGGWTVRQVVHHVPDSHMNSYMRFRLALTEDDPTIKPYNEALWAQLPDARTAPIELSLTMLESIHGRWLILLRALDEASFARTFRHPELGDIRLDWNLGLYAWHGRHHLAHIRRLRELRSW